MQEQLISAINNKNLEEFIQVVPKLVDIEEIPTALNENLKQLLQAENFKAFRRAIFYSNRSFCEKLFALTTIIGGSVTQILSANNFDIFYSAGGNNKDVIEYLAIFIKELGGNELLKDALEADKFRVFNQAIDNGHKDVCVYLESLANEISGTEMTKQMVNSASPSSANSHKEVFLYIASHKHLELEGRKESQRFFRHHKFDEIENVPVPSIDDFGEVGKPYPYAAMRNFIAKVALAVELATSSHKNIKENVQNIISEYHSRCGAVDWLKLNEKLYDLSYEDIWQIPVPADKLIKIRKMIGL